MSTEQDSTFGYAPDRHLAGDITAGEESVA
jgi:hypothetical protein